MLVSFPDGKNFPSGNETRLTYMSPRPGAIIRPGGDDNGIESVWERDYHTVLSIVIIFY